MVAALICIWGLRFIFPGSHISAHVCYTFTRARFLLAPTYLKHVIEDNRDGIIEQRFAKDNDVKNLRERENKKLPLKQ